LISSQVVEQGDFLKQMNLFVQLDIKHFVEISPRDILSKFISETIVNSHVTSSNTFFLELEKQELARNAKNISQRSIDLVNKVLLRLTGYKIENISLNARFEEELGIDSLKKAQIVFELLDESNMKKTVDVSRFKKVSDFFNIISYAEDIVTTEFKIFQESFSETFLPNKVKSGGYGFKELTAKIFSKQNATAISDSIESEINENGIYIIREVDIFHIEDFSI
jgi:acyl carrier protein